MNENTATRAGADWERAPKDGTLINVEFSGGEVVQVRWDARQMHWQVPQRNGDPIMLREERQNPPQDWWPVI